MVQLLEGQPEYIVRDLIGGSQGNCAVSAMNNGGDVVGTCVDISGSRAFVWRQDGGLQLLPNLPSGPNSSSARGINDSGIIVGDALPPNSFGNGHAVRWSASSVEDLGASVLRSSASAVNQSGLVVGEYYPTSSGPVLGFFAQPGGSLSALPLPPGFNSGVAWGVNNQGRIVGFVQNVDGSIARAVMWSGGSVVLLAPNVYSYARSINDLGRVAVTTSSGCGLYKDGTLTDLGSLPGGNCAEAAAINNADLIVGESIVGGGPRAFIWDSIRGMRDLNVLIPDNGVWNLLQPRAINDQGLIVGNGLLNGASRVFRLEPAATITLSTSPPGLAMQVDGVTYNTTTSLTWPLGSTHIVSVPVQQTTGQPTRYQFESWNDGGSAEHMVTASRPGPLVATYRAYYQLNVNALPAGSGTVLAQPTSGDGYYAGGTTVNLNPIPTTGYAFSSWSGALSGSLAQQGILMNGPKAVTANFTLAPVPVTIATNPPGLPITVDSTNYTSPQTFQWTSGSPHTFSATTPPLTAGTRYSFVSWSNGGSQSQTITAPSSATTYSAAFRTQFLLTTSSSSPGSGTISASPPSPDGYYTSGTVVQVSASPATGFQFSGWSGDLSGTATPQNIPMSQPRSVLGNFATLPNCSYSVTPSATAFPASSGAGAIEVAAPAGCSWAAASNTSWISITNSGSGTGNGSVFFSVGSNVGGARTGSIVVAGQTITIQQAGVVGPNPPTGLRFVPLPPCRIMETRPQYNFEGRTGPFGPPFLNAGEIRTVNLTASTICSIPSLAKAYVVNVTVVPASTLNFATVWPAGDPQPSVWTIRSPDGQIVANSAIVKAGANGGISVYASDRTDVLIDISGYYTDSTAVSGLAYYPLTPCRVIDTRSVYRSPAGPFGPPSMGSRETRKFRFPATSYCSVPLAAAYSVTLTAVPPGTPLAYLTAWPDGSSQPNVSSINSPVGRALANSVIIPASADGTVDFFAYDTTDFLVDINGYFAPDDGNRGLFYYPVTQCRVSDSTASGGTHGDDTTRTIHIPAATGCIGIPANAQGYALNVTALPHGNSVPFITAYPTGQSRPNASILNAFQGQIITNAAIVPAGVNGAIDVYAFRATDVVVEVSGYFGR